MPAIILQIRTIFFMFSSKFGRENITYKIIKHLIIFSKKIKKSSLKRNRQKTYAKSRIRRVPSKQQNIESEK